MKVMLDSLAYLPERAHSIDAGLDLRSPFAVTLYPGDSAVVNTGVHVLIPAGYVGMLKSKSGLNVRNGIVSEGVIDAGYTGAIHVKLYNHGVEKYVIRAGDKITQLVVMPVVLEDVELVDSFPTSDRGDGGFGSTGR